MLKLINIKKSYKKAVALNVITLSMNPGVYGLLGPNGAGKSTLMNIITDNLLPDGGYVLWKGEETRKLGKNFRRVLGYAPQQQGLYDMFTGRRFLDYMAALKEIPKKETADEIERAAAAVNLSGELSKKLSAYSGGMKQRILIAQALLGKPELLIMDEPTAGLDPKERIRVREMLARIAEHKVVLVATHVVSDIESIAKEIILLKKGDVIAQGSPSRLVTEYAPGKSMEEVYLTLFGEEDMHVF
ncbi:MAG TPA: ABC transporter ATP-binding protein [Ruminococcaceae bacterium]|nr:ABC transporter ATP-binding protein [Oscillospiraceae bacterium]